MGEISSFAKKLGADSAKESIFLSSKSEPYKKSE